MKRPPELFGYSMIEEAVAQDYLQGDGFIFNRDFAVLNGSDMRMFHYLLRREGPLLINDYRMGLLLEGEVRVDINLMERHVRPGTLVFIGPGTIVQPLEVTDRVRVKGLALFRDLPFTANRLPPLFNGSVRDFVLPLTPAQQGVVERIMDALCLTASTEPSARDTFMALAAALMHQYDHLSRMQAERQVRPSHQADIFNRFVQLVNAHARQQHQLAYYAGRLCLSERYLGTVVRQASGVTAKEWIDRAIVTQAKVMLRHERLSVSQISDALAFPNASFFNKYFKRLTGLTPKAYRDQR